MKKIIKKLYLPVFLGLGILFLFLFLRIKNLTYLPVFADEAIYIRWSQVMRFESTLRFLPLSDGKQPLFMWATIVFLKLFDDPLFAGRFLSVATGMGSLLGVFLLTRILFKSLKVSLLAGLIYVLSPFSFFFDRLALADSMLSMFGIWIFVFSYLAVKKMRLDYSMIAGFLLGGALLTKSPSLFFSILIPSVWIFAEWPKKIKGKFEKLFRIVLLFIPTYLIGYGMYNILRLGPNFHMISSRNADYIFPISHLWENPKDPFIFLIDRSFEWISQMGTWPVLVLALLALVFLFKRFKKEYLILLLWFFFPILIQSEFAKVYTARYILFTVNYLFIIAASLFLVGNRVARWMGMLLFGIFLFTAIRFDYLLLYDVEKAPLPRSERSGYLEEWTAGQGIKDVSEYLINEYQKEPQRKIVVGTEGYFGTLPDGLQIYLQNYPEITVIGVGLNLDEVPSQLVESFDAGNKTYLVINKSRIKVRDFEKDGLYLIEEYPKAMRHEGDREYVMYGPRDSLYFFEVGERKVYSKE